MNRKKERKSFFGTKKEGIKDDARALSEIMKFFVDVNYNPNCNEDEFILSIVL